MTRICENCGFENQDDYDFCAKCGNPLVEGLKPKQIYYFNDREPEINKKTMALAYIVTIFLSWSGFVVGSLFKNNTFGIFTFFGFFLPFYLVQAPVRAIRKHGIIMLAISVVGIFLSMMVLFGK